MQTWTIALVYVESIIILTKPRTQPITQDIDMSHSEQEQPIFRTSPRRLGKLLAIIIGIQVVGAVLFFSHYDFWNSYLPTAGKIQEGLIGGGNTHQGQATGKTVNVSLKFVE